MPKGEGIEVEGVVVEVIRNAVYKVKLPNGHIIDAYLAGRLVVKHISVLEGDEVTVELSPYDVNRGRIVYRDKKKIQQ